MPNSGSRFLKLREHYDFIDVQTDNNSDIGSYEVFLVALKDGLPHEVPVLRLNVLSKRRKLHMDDSFPPVPASSFSDCHSVTATVDPFADWHESNSFFTQVTKTWIY